jgi:hypothetical protein
MGHLDYPLNTFWQLLYRPSGSSTWADQVRNTGVATNGGLVMASPGDRSITAGVLASHLLTYSPVIGSGNEGLAWTTGLLPGGLTARVDALATASQGAALALVVSRDGNDVLSTPSGLSTWNPVTTQAALASTAAGQQCGVTSVDAVAFAGAVPVVGASCSRRGVAGIMAYSGGSWRLVGPSMPAAYRQQAVAVLALRPSSDGMVALLAVVDATGTALVASWSTNGGRTWILSPATPITASEKIESVGGDAGRGVFVLASHSGGSLRLEHVAGPGAQWQALPSPPTATATVAFGPGVATQALAVAGSTLSVWDLPSGGTAWVRGQVLQVPITYGSSS